MSMLENNYDVCVIGSGPGGYVSAIRASQLGLKVCLVEKENLGGVCLNYGCIPTKALLQSAEIYRNILHAEQFGIKVEKYSFDTNKIVEYSRNIVKKLQDGILILMKKNNITVIKGFAKFINKNEVEIEENKIKIKSKYFVIATGARARILSDIEIDEDLICTYKGAMLPKTMPKSLVIIGGGVIGIEFASFYSTFGVKVTVIDVADILATEDHEIVERVKKSLIKSSIDIITYAKFLTAVKINKKSENLVKIQYEKDGEIKEIIVNKMILSVGIIPNTDNINIQSVNVILDKNNFINIDGNCKTNIDNIYAIGDIVSAPWLAHKASQEGVIVAENIAKNLGKYTQHISKINPLNIPSCIYSYPQIASIGFTESKAKELKYDIKVCKSEAFSNGKSLINNNKDGFVKIIFDNKTGELLGAHLIGHEVGEMIHSIALGKTSELIKDDYINTIFPHPSISEMIHEAMSTIH